MELSSFIKKGSFCCIARPLKRSTTDKKEEIRQSWGCQPQWAQQLPFPLQSLFLPFSLLHCCFCRVFSSFLHLYRPHIVFTLKTKCQFPGLFYSFHLFQFQLAFLLLSVQRYFFKMPCSADLLWVDYFR